MRTRIRRRVKEKEKGGICLGEVVITGGGGTSSGGKKEE